MGQQKYQKVSTSIKGTELVIMVIMNPIIVYGGKLLICRQDALIIMQLQRSF